MRSPTTFRRLGFAAAVLVALAAIGSASAAQPSAMARSSTFDSSDEGWFYYFENGGRGFHATPWRAAGGNPGGYIKVTMSGGKGEQLVNFYSTGSSGGGTWDPGNALGDYGGKLQVDLEASDPSYTTHPVIGFSTTNSSVIPCWDEGGFIAAGWNTYWTTLDPSGLADCRFSGHSHPLSAAQASAALAGFAGMFLFTIDDYYLPDTIGLDNASLSGPQSPVTRPTGTVKRKLTLAYSAHKLRGRLTAPDDYSCAGKRKVTIFRTAKKPVRVGTATTSAPHWQKYSGLATFLLKPRKLTKGSYYASATNALSPLDGNTCNAVHSNTVKAR